MRLVSFISAFILSSAAFSLVVPFQNIILSPNASLSASYAFNTHPFIVCVAQADTTLSGGIMQWPYRGRIISSAVSASYPVSLVTSTQYMGQLADQTGIITIQNNQKKNIQASCVFGL